jgi:hypothetical protein
MEKRTKEWLLQADYDIETAEYMFEGGRYLMTGLEKDFGKESKFLPTSYTKYPHRLKQSP